MKNSSRPTGVAVRLMTSLLAAAVMQAAHAAEKTTKPTPAAAVPATRIAGSWHGTLEAGGMTLRLVLDVNEAEGKLGAFLTSVDQGNAKIPVTSISSDSTGARFECAAIAGSFEGKYSTDGNEIAGTWKQGPNSLPLTFKRQPSP